MNERELTKSILQLRDEWVKSGTPSYWAINNGNCESFAEDVIDHLLKVCGKEAESCEIISDGYLLDVDEKWDETEAERELGRQVTLPEGITWDDLNNIPFGSHYWLFYNGRHYDAECPKGVDSFFDLPLYKRYIDHYVSGGTFEMI